MKIPWPSEEEQQEALKSYYSDVEAVIDMTNNTVRVGGPKDATSWIDVTALSEPRFLRRFGDHDDRELARMVHGRVVLNIENLNAWFTEEFSKAAGSRPWMEKAA